jgi:hypothetical protein
MSTKRMAAGNLLAGQVLCLAVSFASIYPAAMAADGAVGNGGKSDADAAQARVQAQVESLQKSKFEHAHHVGAAAKKDAERKSQVVDAKLKQQHRELKHVEDNMSGVFGHEVVNDGAHARRQELNAHAQKEKDALHKHAAVQADRARSEAARSAAHVQQSADNLKTQVGKDGKFGLRPEGSNLHVRHYGH